MDSLRSVAQLLTEAYQPLHDVVHGRTDIPENHSLDTFFSAVKATADVRPAVSRPLCRVVLCVKAMLQPPCLEATTDAEAAIQLLRA